MRQCGSLRLKRCFQYGYDTAGLYAQEWVGQTLAGWQVDITGCLTWRSALHPSNLAFTTFEAHYPILAELDARDFLEGIKPKIVIAEQTHTGHPLPRPLEAIVLPVLNHYTLVHYISPSPEAEAYGQQR